ncbi:MAG: GIY-YIG nuclease family protein [Bacteroidetes bacterium]|nr:GIY-YIG nuclease family protein [Bacteroidota bacterium]
MYPIFYTYILLCSDDSYYVGITNKLQRRLAEHENDETENSYTSSRRPVKLVWFEEHKYVDKAIAREKQIKGWSRAKKEALIKRREFDLPQLAMNTEKKRQKNTTD